MPLHAFKCQVYSYKAVSYRFGDPFCPLPASSRSKFYVREPPHGSPNWPKVGLTLGTSVFLWIYVSTYSVQSCYSNIGEDKYQRESECYGATLPYDRILT